MKFHPHIIMRLGELVKRMKYIQKNIYQMGADIAVNDSEILIQLNRDQMLDGLGNDDKHLPTYEEDPFFKTLAQAKGYENWKSKISRSRTKPRNVMDGYINGKFHASIEFKMMAKQRLKFYSSSKVGKDLGKYTNNRIYGLNSRSIADYRHRFMPELAKKVHDILDG